MIPPSEGTFHLRQLRLNIEGLVFPGAVQAEGQPTLGYFALPVLHHDQLVAEVDARVDRDSSVLNIRAVHQDVAFTRAMASALQAEVEALAQWLGLDGVRTRNQRRNGQVPAAATWCEGSCA
jgi:uncharacterized protein YcaQ